MQHTQRSEEAHRRFRSQLLSWTLPEEIITEITEHTTLVTYAKGTTIFAEGSPVDLFFWVFNGLVEVHNPHRGGTGILVRLVGPGELVGFVERIDRKGALVRDFEARAKTKCEILLLTPDPIARALQRLKPDVLVALIQRINIAWSELLYSAVSLLGINARQRLEVVLLDAAQRFGVRESRGVLLVPQLEHREFAEMVGCSRSMITRLIGEMVDQGMLERLGRQYVLLNDSGSIPKSSRVRVVGTLPTGPRPRTKRSAA